MCHSKTFERLHTTRLSVIVKKNLKQVFLNIGYTGIYFMPIIVSLMWTYHICTIFFCALYKEFYGAQKFQLSLIRSTNAHNIFFHNMFGKKMRVNDPPNVWMLTKLKFKLRFGILVKICKTLYDK